jgi:hypothetical protein
MKLGTHMPDGEMRKPIDIEVCRTKVRSQLLKIEQKLDTFFVSARYLKNEMSDLNESWYTGIVHPYVRNSAFTPLVHY